MSKKDRTKITLVMHDHTGKTSTHVMAPQGWSTFLRSGSCMGRPVSHYAMNENGIVHAFYLNDARSDRTLADFYKKKGYSENIRTWTGKQFARDMNVVMLVQKMRKEAAEEEKPKAVEKAVTKKKVTSRKPVKAPVEKVASWEPRAINLWIYFSKTRAYEFSRTVTLRTKKAWEQFQKTGWLDDQVSTRGVTGYAVNNAGAYVAWWNPIGVPPTEKPLEQFFERQGCKSYFLWRGTRFAEVARKEEEEEEVVETGQVPPPLLQGRHEVGLHEFVEGGPDTNKRKYPVTDWTSGVIDEILNRKWLHVGGTKYWVHAWRWDLRSSYEPLQTRRYTFYISESPLTVRMDHTETGRFSNGGNYYAYDRANNDWFLLLSNPLKFKTTEGEAQKDRSSCTFDIGAEEAAEIKKVRAELDAARTDYKKLALELHKEQELVKELRENLARRSMSVEENEQRVENYRKDIKALREKHDDLEKALQTVRTFLRDHGLSLIELGAKLA